MGSDNLSPFVLYDARNNPVRTSPEMDMVLGTTPGRRSGSSFGFNQDLDIGVLETIQSVGGTWEHDDTLETINFVSTAAADTALGTGARSILIRGIGDDWTEYTTTETLALDGITPVATTRQYRFIIRVTIIGAGTGLTNAGVISGTGATTSYNKAHVLTGCGITNRVVAAIPEGQWALIDEIDFGVFRESGVAGSSLIQLRWHNFGVTDTYRIVVYEQNTNGRYNDVVNSRPLKNAPFPGPSVLEMVATVDTNNSIVHGRLKYTLVEDAQINAFP